MSEQQRIIQEAARWLAYLQSGEQDPALERSFLAWRTADPRHAHAIESFQVRLGMLQRSALSTLSDRQVLGALEAPSSRRRVLRGALTLAAVAVGAGLLPRVGSTGFAWPSDLYTGIGERRTFALADGSDVQLNAVTRVSPDFAPGRRGLRVHCGELLLNVRRGDPPFVVDTGIGRAAVDERQLLLRQEREGWLLLASQQAVQLTDNLGNAHRIQPGHWARFNAAGVFDQGLAHGGETEWVHGLLEVDNRPLDAVIERLRPYHRVVIRLDPRIAALRVSGLFPLDDSDHTLAMLARALPIRVSSHAGLWVTLEPA